MALLAATTFTSCNNSLDETVYSEILEQSYNYQKSDFASNIVGAYSVLRGSTQMFLWQTQELSSCEVVTAPNISGWDDGGIYLQFHYHNWNSELGAITTVWNDYYRGAVL